MKIYIIRHLLKINFSQINHTNLRRNLLIFNYSISSTTRYIFLDIGQTFERATLNRAKIRNLIWLTSDSIPARELFVALSFRINCNKGISNSSSRDVVYVSLWKVDRPMNTQEPTSSIVQNRIFPFLNETATIVKPSKLSKDGLVRILHTLKFD